MQENTITQTALPQRFYEILQEEIVLSGEMLGILAKEKEALVAMNIATLAELSEEKEACVARLQGLDSELQNIARTFAGTSSGSFIRLRALAALLAPEEIAYLEGFRVRLDGLREEIATRNLINRNFTEETRKFLSEAISLITSTVVEQQPQYGRGLRTQRPASSLPSFISREV